MYDYIKYTRLDRNSNTRYCETVPITTLVLWNCRFALPAFPSSPCLNTRSEHDVATVKLYLLLSWYHETVALRYQSNVYYWVAISVLHHFRSSTCPLSNPIVVDRPLSLSASLFCCNNISKNTGIIWNAPITEKFINIIGLISTTIVAVRHWNQLLIE